MTNRKIRLFSSGQSHKNAQDLDCLSAQGQQLLRAGILRYEFTQEDGPQRHCLDYCPTPLGEAEMARRQELFEENGWELVNTTATGWRFFRRPIDPYLPPEAYESPCPRTQQEQKRICIISLLFWLRIPILAAGAVLAVLAMIRGKGMVLPAVGFGLSILALTMGMHTLQEKLRP